LSGVNGASTCFTSMSIVGWGKRFGLSAPTTMPAIKTGNGFKGPSAAECQIDRARFGPLPPSRFLDVASVRYAR
jgi:hypothetical protein